MIVGAGLSANCQAKSDTTCLDTKDLDAMLSTTSTLREQVSSLSLLKNDTLMLRQTIKLKDQAFKAQKEQLDFNRQVIADQMKALADNKTTIDALKKQKGSVLKRVFHVVLAGLVGYAIGKF